MDTVGREYKKIETEGEELICPLCGRRLHDNTVNFAKHMEAHKRWDTVLAATPNKSAAARAAGVRRQRVQSVMKRLKTR